MGDITPFVARTKAFCKHCGTKLVMQKAILDYDEYTGEANIIDTLECPACSRPPAVTQQPWFPNPTRHP